MKASNLLLLPVIGLFVAWFALLRPVELGGPVSYVQVDGTSMEPTLHSGDLAVVQKQRSYSEGDVVAFRVSGGVVIHRIVDVTAEGFVTQGTNSQGTDPWRPTADDVVGRLWFSVPAGGRLLAPLRVPAVLAGLAAAVAVSLVLSGKRRENRQPEQQGSLPAALPKPGHLRAPSGLTLCLLLAVMGTAVVFRWRH